MVRLSADNRPLGSTYGDLHTGSGIRQLTQPAVRVPRLRGSVGSSQVPGLLPRAGDCGVDGLRSVRVCPAAISQQYGPRPSLRSNIPEAANQRLVTAVSHHNGYSGQGHLPVRGLNLADQLHRRFTDVQERRAEQYLAEHHLRARQRHPAGERLPRPVIRPLHVRRRIPPRPRWPSRPRRLRGAHRRPSKWQPWFLSLVRESRDSGKAVTLNAAQPRTWHRACTSRCASTLSRYGPIPPNGRTGARATAT